ncbi:MAG: lysophospholipid acyltransferase family protein [Sphingobacterium composti]|uniref:lysophospholipid acyltransferase family protein n=1 Tax=Sphingobacterium composti TaxID=363260 RepID=UPI0013574E9B|nr:lysophospholipid acyltransferase family protein [Sphingobacterium composti Ten et al. 2007 non Yoo et al. 2007]
MSKGILQFIFRSISILPFSILYIISDVLFVLIYYVIGYRKKVVFKNLRNSFPEISEKEIEGIAKRFYKYFPDLIVEAIKMASITQQEVIERIELLNTDEIERHFLNGKGIICVTSHYSNWEWGIHRLSFMTDYPRLVIYKPLNNKDFDQVYNGIRTRFGATMVPMKQILRHIVKLRNSPYFSVFVADQTPVYQESDYFLNFLNQETLVYTGPERIAKMTNNPVVFCEIIPKDKRGFYYAKFTTLVENPSAYEPYEITQIHNKYTEELIRKKPEYWLWTHNRWKRKRRNKA